MKRISIRAATATAAVLLVATGASGDVDRTTLAARYAEFQRQQARKWFLESLLSPVTQAVDRTLRHTLRVTSGGVNPANTPMFGSDLDQRRPHVDAHVRISEAQAASKGRDVLVAVLDSGFNTAHPMIAPRVLPYGFDAVSHDWDPNDRGNGVDDDQNGAADEGVGHGTFVAGTVLHVAPEAWILPVRIADDEGRGLEAELLAGLDYALAMGVDVVNISYEAAAITLGVRDKLRQVHDAGIVVVVSAGNDASEEAKTLAADGTTIAVGAVDDDDRVASFSNAPSDGRGMTLFAPGVRLWGPHGGPSDDACCTWSGTSFSAPLVTGAVAMALELTPSLTPAQARDRMRAASVAPVTTWSGGTYAFAGRLDLRVVVAP